MPGLRRDGKTPNHVPGGTQVAVVRTLPDQLLEAIRDNGRFNESRATRSIYAIAAEIRAKSGPRLEDQVEEPSWTPPVVAEPIGFDVESGGVIDVE